MKHGDGGGASWWAVWSCCLVVGAAVGCRNDASQRDAYIRELRMHEDQIYELQDYMTEYQHLLCEQRKENARLRAQLAADAKGDAAAADEVPDAGERSLLERPAPPDAGPSDDDEPDLPDIDLGEPITPDIDMGEEVPAGELGNLGEATRTPDVAQASHQAVFEVPPQPVVRAESCAIYAEQMPLEPTATTPDANIGVMAIVEPLTAEGDAGYFTGEVSLMLVDPLASDDAWEVSRWDYTAEEVEHAWRDRARRVLDLPLAAPSTTPLGRPLELWVRMIPTDEDRKILCSTAVTLTDRVGVPISGGQSTTEPGVVSSGWTAADKLYASADTQQPPKAATWQAATMLPPPAVARAEATSVSPPTEQPELAKRAPEWSPFR